MARRATSLETATGDRPVPAAARSYRRNDAIRRRVAYGRLRPLARRDPIELERPRRRVNRERALRTRTSWLRPEFVLRVLNRFQKIAGFDRAVARASSALTATIPLALVLSAVSTQLGGKGLAERLIARYHL